MTISSLFLGGRELTVDDALLVKWGVEALCPLAQDHGNSRAGGLSRTVGWLRSGSSTPLAGPLKMRWGLWRMPAPLGLTHGNARSVRRAIDRTVAAGGMLHLHVDLVALGAARRRGGEVETVLRHLGHAQETSRLRLSTMREVVAGMSRPRAIAPARSILRKAA